MPAGLADGLAFFVGPGHGLAAGLVLFIAGAVLKIAVATVLLRQGWKVLRWLRG